MAGRVKPLVFVAALLVSAAARAQDQDVVAAAKDAYGNAEYDRCVAVLESATIPDENVVAAGECGIFQQHRSDRQERVGINRAERQAEDQDMREGDRRERNECVAKEIERRDARRLALKEAPRFSAPLWKI